MTKFETTKYTTYFPSKNQKQLNLRHVGVINHVTVTNLLENAVKYSFY